MNELAGKIVDATLRFVDKFTSPIGRALDVMERGQRQAGRLGKSIQKVGKKIESTGKKLTSGVTLPIATMGTACINASANFEESMSKVQAISGATGSELETLNKKALEMGKTTKFSATESAEAMKYMALAGWKTEDMCNGIAGIMNLAAASGEDLASTSDIVTDALTAFGLAAKDATHFADVLAATSSNSNTTVAELGEAFKYSASIAGSMGYSVEDVAQQIGLMANSGIHASNAGTAMRKIMTELKGTVTVTGKEIGKVAIQCSNQDGSMRSLNDIINDCRTAFAGMTEEEKTANAESLVGKTAMAGFLAIVNSGEGDIKKLSGAINNCDGTSKKMADTMNDNLKGQLTLLKSQLEGIAISLGNKLTPYVKKATTFVSGLATKFSNLSSSQQNTVIKVGLVLAALGPCVVVIGKLTKGIGKVISCTKTVVKVLGKFRLSNIKATASVIKHNASLAMTKARLVASKIAMIAHKGAQLAMTAATKASTIAQAALNTTMFGCPITWIVAGITAVIAVGVLLYKNWDKVKEKASDLWNGIKDIFGKIGGWFSGIWEGVKAGFKSFINFIIKGLNMIPNGLNKLSVKVPKWVPKVGGKKLGFNVPTIPYLAKGTDNWVGGLAVTQEKGGEIMDIPRGTRVYPHDESVRRAYKDGQHSVVGKGKIVIQKLADKITVRNDSDIDSIVDKLATRLLDIIDNGGGEVLE